MSKPSSDTDAAKPEKAKRNKRRVVLRVLLGLLLLPFLLVAIALVLLYLPPVQDVVRGKAVSYLSEKVGTPVGLERLYLRFPLGVELRGLQVGDQQGDTLLHAGSIKVRVGLRALLQKRILLDPIELSDVHATLRQAADSSYNFDHILQAFASSDAEPAQAAQDSSAGFELSIGDIHLERIRFRMALEPSDLDLEMDLGELVLDFDRFSLDPMVYHVDDLGLKDTRITMRTRSGEPTAPSYPQLENPLAGIDVRFNDLDLENVFFSMSTIDTGDSLWISVDRTQLEARSMDLTKQQLALETLDFEGLRFGMLGHSTTASKGAAAESDPLWLDQNDGFRFWIQDWDLSIDRLRMADGEFAMHSDRVVPPALLFDPDHIVLTGMKLEASDVSVTNTRVALDLKQLLVHAGAGAVPLELAFQAEATPSGVSLHGGALQAMNNAITFSLDARQGDLATAYRQLYDVPIEVELGGDLQLAELWPLLKEIGIELPVAQSVNERWDTHLWLSGTPRRADRMGLTLTGDQGSRIMLKGSTRQADRWPFNTFELDLEQLIMGRGMRQVLRSYVPAGIDLPQRFAMRGNASGDKGTVRTVIAMDSDLGRITAFAVVNDWVGLIPDGVDLALNATGLDLGRLLGDTALAPASFKLIAGGTDLNSSTREGSLSLDPQVLSYAGNDLSSLFLQVTALGDSLDMELSSRAEAIDVLLDAKGRWPGPEDSLALDLDLVIQELRLKDLGITQHVLNTDGRFRGRIALTHEGFGSIGLQGEGLRLSNADREFRFERFRLHALLGQDSTAVDLDSDAITLNYHTNLGIDSLIPRTQAKLVSFFQPEGEFLPTPGKRMDLELTLPRPEWLTGILVPELRTLDLRAFKGNYSSDTDELSFVIDLPHAEHDGIEVHGLTLNVDAKANRLQATLGLQRAERDSLFLENMALEARTANDMLQLQFISRRNDQEEYRIGAALNREQGVPVLRMDKDLLLHSEPWTADSTNALFFTANGLRAENFTLSSNAQHIELLTGKQSNRLSFTDLELVTITGLISSLDSLPLATGLLNGTLRLPFADGALLAAEVNIGALTLKDVRIGDLSARVSEQEGQRYRGQLALADAKNHLEAKADLDLSQEKPSISAVADMALDDLSFLKPFVSQYVFALTGELKGQLRYVQDGDKVSVLGRTVFENAGVGVIQTGSIYRFPKESLIFDEQGLLLEDVTVLDSSDNRFRLDGRVLTNVVGPPKLDMRLRTERFQLVNSTIEQNPMFFGDLFGSMDLRIEGTATSPVVRGDVGILEGTRLSVTLPGSKVELVEHEGIVLFTDNYEALDTLGLSTDGQMLRDSLVAQLPGVELDLNIKLDERAVFAVVIDPTTGDEATFSGGSDLVFRYQPGGDMYLRGAFTVAKGSYTLEFYGLVKKHFELVPGGTVVWDGELLQGRMNVQARYRSNTAPFPLVANAGGAVTEDERNRLQARLPFDVLINIRESLSAPDITFGLDLDRMARNNFPQVNTQLEQLAQPANAEELNRQVFALLVLNTFIQDESSTTEQGSSLATTAARNSVNSILTDQMNNLTGSMIKGMDIQLGVNTYDQSTGGEVYQRTSVDYKVSQRLLNDRVNIEAGGSIGVDERNPSVGAVSNTNAAQYAITYDLSKDGRFRLRGFHENAFDLFDGEIINNGVALVLTRDFEENAKDRDKRRKLILQQREAEAKPEEE